MVLRLQGASNGTLFGLDLGFSGGLEGFTEQELPSAIHLSHDPVDPLGEVFAVVISRFWVHDRFGQFLVLCTKLHLDLEADLWDVQFHGFKHVHHTCCVAAVPNLVIIFVAAGDQVRDQVFDFV